MPIKSWPWLASSAHGQRVLSSCVLGTLMAVMVVVLGACSASTVTTVAVTISGLDDSVESVLLDAKLGELPVMSKLPALKDSLDSFTVRLTSSDTGELWLQAQAIGPDGCVIQQGNTKVTISALGDYTATITVAAQQGCLLEVIKVGGGAGRVTLSDGTVWDFPNPTDAVTTCPVEEDSPSKQQKVYTLSKSVDLQAAALPNSNSQTTSYFGGWEEGCSGSGDCSVTIGPGTTTVRLTFLPTEACSLSHFCWEQPRPQGANLRQISGQNTNDVWAVGEAGSMLRWNGSYWLSPHRPQLHTNLNGIWVGTKGNVWAVGESGTVLHRDTNGLWACPTTLTTVTLNDIWGSGDSDIWTVGAQATILHWNGTAWSQVAAPSGVTVDLSAVSGSSDSDVWITGASGTLLHYDGSTWTKLAFPTSDGLSGVWAAGPNKDKVYSAWVVGDNGLTAQIVDTKVTTLPSGVVVALEAVWGSSSEDVWAAGQQGVLLHYTAGKGWARVNPGIGEDLRGLWGSGSSEIWAIGTDGAMTYFNGVSWLPLLEALAKNAFNGVWGPIEQPSDSFAPIWAVGAQGQVLRWSGFDWILDPFLHDKTPMDLQAVWGSSKSDVWMVGNGGVSLHLVDTITGSMKSTGTTSDLYAVWGSAQNDVIAVGASGTLTAYNGNAWSAQTLTAAAGSTLRAVWGSAQNQVWLAGDGGLLLSWDGTTATKFASGTAASVRGLWGSSATDIWAVGDAGTLLHYTSGAWSASSQSGQLTTHNILSIWGLSATDIWASGDLGTLFHYDGTTWSQVDSGFDKSLNSIWANATQGVITVGRAGSILRYLD